MPKPTPNTITVINKTEQLASTNHKYSQFYTIIARLYDLGAWLFFLPFGGETAARMEYLESLSIKPGDRVLEVSVGTGANLRLLPAQATYFGVDISSGMLQKCVSNLRKWGREAFLYQAEAEHLPFDGNFFDVVYHVGGINYFSDKRAALAEMVRVAKPKSQIVIVDETDKFFEKFRMIPFLTRFFQTGKATQPPTENLPKNVEQLVADEVLRGNYWRMRFWKK